MFRFLSGMMQRMEEDRRLEELREKFKTAESEGKKHCLRCGFCCYARTCIPTPAELKKIAKFLKLTPTELIKKYYVVDRIDFDDSYYVKPAGENIKDLVGKFIPAERTFNEGKCVFLDKNNLCKIYSVRPQSAKDANCWKKDDMKSPSKIIKRWKGNQLLKQFGIDGDKLEESC